MGKDNPIWGQEKKWKKKTKVKTSSAFAEGQKAVSKRIKTSHKRASCTKNVQKGSEEGKVNDLWEAEGSPAST